MDEASEKVETESVPLKSTFPVKMFVSILAVCFVVGVTSIGAYFLGIRIGQQSQLVNDQQLEPVTPYDQVQDVSPPVTASPVALQKTMVSEQVFNSQVSAQYYPTADTMGWEMYKNEEYGFSFLHPSNTQILPQEGDSVTYFRFQNYSNNEFYSRLEEQEYYLEIFITNKSEGAGKSNSCAEEMDDPEGFLTQPIKVQLGERVGYRGLGYQGGESGGTRLAICVDADDYEFSMKGVEGVYPSPIINSIFDSLVFMR